MIRRLLVAVLVPVVSLAIGCTADDHVEGLPAATRHVVPTAHATVAASGAPLPASEPAAC